MIRYLAVVLAGLLTGSELTSKLIVHPALWRLPYEAQVDAEQRMYRRFATVDPFLMTATIVVGLLAAASLDGRRAGQALAGAICYSLMLAITLIGNMPLNVRILRWAIGRGDPAEWRSLRRRWDRLHRVRIVLDVAGFLLIAAAVAWP